MGSRRTHIMATDQSALPGKNLPWAGKQVRPERVEDELTSFWHLAADNMRISQNMNVRTSVLNFVICALDEKSAYQVSSLLRDLSSTLIARVTLLILDQHSGNNEISTWVTLRSFSVISDVMRHHFEQVTVRLSGNAVRAAATIIQPLLKPDLPIYLWWTDDLPDDYAIFQNLINASDRAIIDSSDFRTPTESVQALPRLLRDVPECGLSDFNWSRITPWRELVAQFSDVAQYRPYLVNVNRIEIEHAVASDTELAQNGAGKMNVNPVRALFLAAWMKTRLGWQTTDETNKQVDIQAGQYSWHLTRRVPTSALTGPLANAAGKIDRPTQSLDLTIRPRLQSTLRPGNICLVRATGMFQGKEAVFTINRDDDDVYVTTSVAIPGYTTPSRMVSIAATQKESDLLTHELEILGHDQLYEQVIHEVFALLS